MARAAVPPIHRNKRPRRIRALSIGCAPCNGTGAKPGGPCPACGGDGKVQTYNIERRM